MTSLFGWCQGLGYLFHVQLECLTCRSPAFPDVAALLSGWEALLPCFQSLYFALLRSEVEHSLRAYSGAHQHLQEGGQHLTPFATQTTVTEVCHLPQQPMLLEQIEISLKVNETMPCLLLTHCRNILLVTGQPQPRGDTLKVVLLFPCEACPKEKILLCCDSAVNDFHG